MHPVLSIVLPVAVSGCALERGGLGGGADDDAGRALDAAGADAADLDGSEPPAVDGGALDAKNADGARPDAPAPSCEEQYGAVEGYLRCEERPDRCIFRADVEDASCAEVCSAAGGTCIEAYDNAEEAATACTPLTIVGCTDEDHVTNLCECSRL